MPNAFPPQHQNGQPGLEYIMKPAPVSECNGKRRKLEGKTAVITGGDSGIGRAVAYDFVKEGASVAIVYYNEDKDAEETAERIRQLGGNCILIKGDLKNPEFTRICVQKTIGNNEIGSISGNIVSWKSVSQERLDTKTLKSEHPTLYQKYANTTTYRRFSVKSAE